MNPFDLLHSTDLKEYDIRSLRLTVPGGTPEESTQLMDTEEAKLTYYQQHQTYYHNTRALGLVYEGLDYTQDLPFIWMLSGSLIPVKGDKL